MIISVVQLLKMTKLEVIYLVYSYSFEMSYFRNNIYRRDNFYYIKVIDLLPSFTLEIQTS